MRAPVVSLVALLAGCPAEPEVTGADLQAALDRIEALEAELAAARAEIDAIETYDDAALSDRITGLEAGLDEVTANGAGVIREDRTLLVPSEYPTIPEALRWLQSYNIAHPAAVTIQVSDGTHLMNAPLEVDHRDGPRIRIRGNEGDPSKVVLLFDGTEAGIYVLRGRSLGRLSGLTVRAQNDTIDSQGIFVGETSSLRCGTGVVVENWKGDGLGVNYNSSVRCDGLISRNNGMHGMYAARGSSLRARDARADGNGAAGIRAFFTSFADVSGAQANDNGTEDWHAGFLADAGSGMVADRSRSTFSSGPGYHATSSSSMYVRAGYAADNAGDGYSVSEASSLWAGDASQSLRNYRGIGAQGASSGVTWGGLTVRDATDDGAAAGGSSNLVLSDANIRDSGAFGVNVYWGSMLRVEGATASTGSGILDYNLVPDTNPTATASAFTWSE